MAQIKFENQLSYELYEGIADENPEKSKDLDDITDTYNMSYSADKFIVKVTTTREIIKEYKPEISSTLWGLDIRSATAKFGKIDYPNTLHFKTGIDGCPEPHIIVLADGSEMPFDQDRHYFTNMVDTEEELYVRGNYE